MSCKKNLNLLLFGILFLVLGLILGGEVDFKILPQTAPSATELKAKQLTEFFERTAQFAQDQMKSSTQPQRVALQTYSTSTNDGVLYHVWPSDLIPLTPENLFDTLRELTLWEICDLNFEPLAKEGYHMTLRFKNTFDKQQNAPATPQKLHAAMRCLLDTLRGVPGLTSFELLDVNGKPLPSEYTPWSMEEPFNLHRDMLPLLSIAHSTAELTPTIIGQEYDVTLSLLAWVGIEEGFRTEPFRIVGTGEPLELLVLNEVLQQNYAEAIMERSPHVIYNWIFIISLTAYDGTAYINFSAPGHLLSSTGSAGARGFYSLIDENLKQFPQIEKVHLLLNGETFGLHNSSSELPHTIR